MFFSIEFGLAFFAFFVAYWLCRANHRLQNLVLLIANYAILLLLGNAFVAIVLACYTLFIYAASIAIAKSESKAVFLAFVALSICNLSFFKYYANFKDGFESILTFFHLNIANIDILMPLGLSFYTFASITYLRSIYEAKRDKATLSYQAPSDASNINPTTQILPTSPSGVADYVIEQNPKLQSLPNLAIYLSFFPTIIAGPIIRSDFFFSQLHATRFWRAKNAHLIIVLLCFGIVKKVLFATYASSYSSPILANPLNHNSLELALAMCGYSVEIYCDFSGYVDLVSAVALMLGFVLPPNFNMPYMARNLKDFWARWHISLSTFIRDFIYIPLGGSRCGFLRTQFALLVAFVLSGIWHGSTINFMIWGLAHGLGIVWLNTLKHFSHNSYKSTTPNPAQQEKSIKTSAKSASKTSTKSKTHQKDSKDSTPKDFTSKDSLASQPKQPSPYLFGSSALGVFLSSFCTFAFVTIAWVFFRFRELDESLGFLNAFWENLSKPIYLSEALIALCGLLLFALYPKLQNFKRSCIYTLYKVPPIAKPLVLAFVWLVAFCFMPDGIPNFIYANF